MEFPAPPHPTDQTLHDYGLGKLDERAAQSVDSHLEECPECQRRVGELSGDSFLGRLQEAQRDPETSASAPLQRDSLPPELAHHPDYEVVRELGRGGMGVVYLARNSLMGRLEVLKVIGKHLVQRKSVLERFLREIRSAARLQHPNIVTAYSAMRLGESVVFTMEYVDGLDLARMVKTKGPLPVAHAAFFVHQAALGLQHAHEKGMVHRDIKPANLMLARDGKKAVVKVLDFGLAKVASERPVDGGLTQEGQMLGTPDYIAPEQMIDAQKADIRADIYSLGCTLYYLLTGGPPFQATSLYELLQAHHSMDAMPLNLARPEVPVELAALVAKMMAKEPERRFQTPGEVARALTPFFKPEARGASPEISRTDAAPARAKTEPAAPAPAPSSMPKAGVEGVGWETLIDFKEPVRPDEVAAPRPADPVGGQARPRWVVPVAVAAGVLLLALVAAVAFRVRTKQGTIIVENLPAQAKVLVDGDTVALDGLGSGGPVEIRVEPGGHRLEVKRAGITVYVDDELEVGAGGTARVGVRLERLASAHTERGEADVAPVAPIATKAVEEANAWPEALSLRGQVFPSKGRIRTMSTDCRLITATSPTGDFRIIEAPGTGKEVELVGRPLYESGDPRGIVTVDFSPDGNYLAAALHDIRGMVWNTTSGAERTHQKGGRGYTIAYSPDGARLASGSYHDKVIHVWDAATGEKQFELGPFSSVVAGVAFSPDGKWLASGSGPVPGDKFQEGFGLEAELKLWNLETGTGSVLEGHALRVHSVAFSPDGKRLASVSFDKTVKVWDLATRKCLVTFDKHKVPVLFTRFSPDGRLMASIGRERGVRVWDSASGRELATLAGLPGDPAFVRFSPAGRWIFAGSKDTLKAWETPADRAPEARPTASTRSAEPSATDSADAHSTATVSVPPPSPSVGDNAAKATLQSSVAVNAGYQPLRRHLRDGVLRHSGSTWTIRESGAAFVASEAFGRTNVLVTHPVSPRNPATLNFSKITRGSSGDLVLLVHAIRSPANEGERLVVKVDGKTTHETTVRIADGWKTIVVPFRNSEVIIEHHAVRWNWEYLFLDFDIREAGPSAGRG